MIASVLLLVGCVGGSCVPARHRKHGDSVFALPVLGGVVMQHPEVV